MTINEFLIYAATAGGATALLSFLTERWPAFQTWTPSQRSYFSLGGSVALALAAWAILTFVPPDVLETLKAPFQVVAGVVIAWLANQFGHSADPARVRPVSIEPKPPQA